VKYGRSKRERWYLYGKSAGLGTGGTILHTSAYEDGTDRRFRNVGNYKPDAGELLFYYYYWYSAFGPVWAETRAQSGDWYGSGTLHPWQVLRGSLPLLSPAFLDVPTFHYQVPPRPRRGITLKKIYYTQYTAKV